MYILRVGKAVLFTYRGSLLYIVRIPQFSALVVCVCVCTGSSADWYRQVL